MDIENNYNFQRCFENLKSSSFRYFIIRGVHGHQDHLFKIIEILGKKKEILLHCFLDGRDSSPISGYDNMKNLLEKIKIKKI